MPLPEAYAVPALSASPRGPILSWLVPTPNGPFQVRFALFRQGRWSAAATVAEERSPWLSPADPPRVHAFPDGTLVAHWARRNGDAPYAYGTRLALKAPGGTWGTPRALHEDHAPVQHGLPSAVLESPERMRFLWLDARGATPGLRERRLDRSGRLGIDRELDPMTCSCCRIALSRLGGGRLLAAYRDRTEGEIRDIRLLRRTAAGVWEATGWRSDDGWEITGCPVNGPALATDGDTVALAWFSAAMDRPRLWLVRSRDAGSTFSSPVRVDAGNPIGRPSLAFAADGRLVAAWLEQTSSGPRVFVQAEPGTRGTRPRDAGPAPGRFASYPELLVVGDDLLLFVAGQNSARMLRLDVDDGAEQTGLTSASTP